MTTRGRPTNSNLLNTQSKESRAAWVATLDKLTARDPAIVVADHRTPDAATDLGCESARGPRADRRRKLLKSCEAVGSNLGAGSQ